MSHSSLLEKYARVLCEYSCNVQKGHLVLIRSESPQAQPLVKEIYKQVLQKGGNPIVRCGMDELSEVFIKYANDEQLAYIDPITQLEYEKIDVIISVGAPTNVKNMARSDSQKMAKRSSARVKLSELMLGRAARGELSWVIADYPTNALAQEAKMSLEEYTDFLIKACHLDLDDPISKWKEIGKEQDRIVNYLNGTSKMRFVGERTDITFSTEGRKWVSCCGLNNFPDGEIFTSPIEDSASGEIYFDYPAIYQGSESHKIYMKLENGKVVEAQAEKGEEFLISMLDMDQGARFVGEIAIGTNEAIQDVTGNILFDEKIGGSIHVAFGSSYPETGGCNVSGLHWDIIKNMKNNSQIFADDKLIYENGKFLI
ncbi:peptidase M29 aminopeptidase II [Candidatus Gastranaerophilus sp. (ex Termes propinquus)]|nr:peptidase M29 aminopeptidase II [Candidatus Gastranaerophilus sp. (ex Termes propinquus)]